MKRKKNPENLQKADSLIEFLKRQGEQFVAAGIEPTEEDWKAEIIAWQESRPTPTKREREAKKLQQLQSYIEIANKLPPDRYAMDIDFFRDEPQSPAPGLIEYDLKRFRFLLLYLEEPETPPDFRAYILEDVTTAAINFARSVYAYVPDDKHIQPLSEIYSALQKYDDFRGTREKLRAIARMTTEKRWFRSHTVPVYSYLYRDSKGLLQPYLDLFAETVRGLEAARIRECPVCRRIFYADRRDKTCCSKPCSNVFNVRQYRKQRSENRKHKREMSKRKNGRQS